MRSYFFYKANDFKTPHKSKFLVNYQLKFALFKIVCLLVNHDSKKNTKHKMISGQLQLFVSTHSEIFLKFLTALRRTIGCADNAVIIVIYRIIIVQRL